jgi:outer membrane protein TolC
VWAVLCIIGLPVLGWAGPGRDLAPSSYGYFDFATCVRYALVHSDVLLKSRIDIQIKSLDLKDSHSEIVPTFQVVTRYYLARAGDDQSPLNVQFTMTHWNPYLAILKIKNGNILVDIAKIAHRKKISDGISEIAKIFLQIDLIKKKIRAYKQRAALALNKVNYGQSKGERGVIDPLEVRIWKNVLRGERLRIKELKQEKEDQVAALKALMGYHPDYHLPLDTRDAMAQILSGFDGRLVTFGQIQSRNWELKLAAKKEQLLSNMVTGSYVALIPQPLLVVEDFNNQQDRASGFNLALGLNYDLWDGFRKVRRIAKRKMESRQAFIDRKEMSRELYTAYRTIQGQLGLTGEREAIAREQNSLAELSEERAIIKYKAGDLGYDRYTDSRLEKVAASLKSVEMAHAKAVALVNLADLSGGLSTFNPRIRH